MTPLNKTQISHVIKHQPPMLLIDSITDWDADCIRSEVLHEKPTCFSRENGTTPSWLVIEYLAQTAAIYDGIQRKSRGQPPRIGFLLGTRKLHVSQPYFQRNERISMLLKQELQEDADSIAVFSCHLYSGATNNETLIAQGLIKAIAPNDPDAIIHKSASENL